MWLHKKRGNIDILPFKKYIIIIYTLNGKIYSMFETTPLWGQTKNFVCLNVGT